MMENTLIRTYGTGFEKDIALIFDWQAVLSSSDLFLGSKYNSDIFSLVEDRKVRIADLSVHGRTICVHPGEEDVIRHVINVLERVVANYYRCKCVIECTSCPVRWIISLYALNGDTSSEGI